MSSRPIHTLLPLEVQEALKKAARAPGTERDRRIAIDKVTRNARMSHPNRFKDENHETETYECPSFLSPSV